MAYARDGGVFYPHLTVAEHVQLVSLAHGSRASDDRIEELLDIFELDHRAGFQASELSSGMRQKLLLACTFARPMRLLLLDEATRALDPGARTVLWRQVVRARAAGTAVVFSAHHLDFPDELGRRVIVLRDGAIEADGTLGEVLPTDAARRLGLTTSQAPEGDGA